MSSVKSTCNGVDNAKTLKKYFPQVKKLQNCLVKNGNKWMY